MFVRFAHRVLVVLSLVSSTLALTPVTYDDFTWHEIQSVEHLTPWLLETGGVIKVKNDSTVIMPQTIMDWAAHATDANSEVPIVPKPNVFIQSDFSEVEITYLPNKWTPVSPCMDNSHSETPTTVVKAITIWESRAQALKVHFALLESHVKFKTTFLHTDVTTQKAFCEVDPGSTLQIQAKTNRIKAENVAQRTITAQPELRREGYAIAFGNWTKMATHDTVYEVGYTLGCITSPGLLQCGEEREASD